MIWKHFLYLWLLLLSPPVPAYQVGERLKAAPTLRGTNNTLYQEIQWVDLEPKGWNPRAALKGINLNRLQDGDPKAMEAMARLKAAWDQAPVEPALDGKTIRLAGFVIPLERKGDLVSELLLVPYFGACIHVPPPPANQTIHVLLKRPVGKIQMMDTFWVSGTLKTGHGDSGLGTYGYRLNADRLEPYLLPVPTK